MSSKMFSGEQNQVIRYRSIYSRPQNYFFPYEAILFDFHTHKENPFPSQTDLRGSCLQTIQHKKSEVNPLYSIGRCKDDTIELLCYRFEKEMLPSLQKKEEIKECLDYFDMLASDAMYPMKNISPKKAMQTDISFFAEVLNEVPLLNAFAITIPLKSPKPLNIVSK